MKLIGLLFFQCIFSLAVKSQDAMVEKVRGKIDSIINKVKSEPGENKKVALLLSIYDVSIDGYPVLLFETYQKLYSLSQQNKDIILESSAWSAAGQAYRLAGNYVKALECHQKGITLAEKTGNKVLLQYAQNQMAHIYKDRMENEKALSLYRSAGGMNEKNDIAVLKTYWAPMNMGVVYLNMGKLDSAFIFLTKAYELYPKNQEEATLIYLFSNLGSVYSKKNDSAKAKAFFSKAIFYANKFQSPRFFNRTYIDIAEHYCSNQQPDSCMHYAKKAVDAVLHTSLSNLALKPARLLAEMYQNNNADSAAKYWQVYTVANDSLNSTRANQQLMMMAFEEDQRQKDLAAEKTNYRNKIKMNLVLAGLAVVVVIAVILFRNNRQKKKANKALENTLLELKSTQTQLIQSEKMASLGELTAGIAHEIQNPLNFVNNFSEVSTELVDEMNEELATGNTQSAIEIANDLKQNLEKINHHGKRAGDIVKGMLAHSRTSSGQKELTDINALCDEYLRLSYHGLRAKDKSFNAKFKTDFDTSLPNIDVVPQDLGRVILNLINNAFYAVDEKKNAFSGKPSFENLTSQYEPTVYVTTKKAGGKIMISVKDNGNGIPQKILDKIFQPFFTTKPTGKGTGLGLSLSYDIVKAHGGELKVETKENEGTTFIIQLPG